MSLENIKEFLMNYTLRELETLEQLWSVTWIGDIVSKSALNKFEREGLAQRGYHDFCWLTADGVEFVAKLKTAKGDGDPPHWRIHFERFGQGGKQVGLDPKPAPAPTPDTRCGVCDKECYSSQGAYLCCRNHP